MTDAAPDKIRLDKWLWHARFVKTRSLAARLCADGIRIDGVRVEKPGIGVRPGQVLTFTLGRHVRVIELVAIGVRRGPAEEARTLYRDLAPPAVETAIPRDTPF
jgi:ribosome-associated heat shock protein Hsp15